MRQNTPPLMPSGADMTCKRPRPKGAPTCRVREQLRGLPGEVTQRRVHQLAPMQSPLGAPALQQGYRTRWDTPKSGMQRREVRSLVNLSQRSHVAEMRAKVYKEQEKQHKVRFPDTLSFGKLHTLVNLRGNKREFSYALPRARLLPCSDREVHDVSCLVY